MRVTLIRILRERYAEFGPTLATEKLAERHQIVLAKETVRRFQIDAGLWIPRRLRPPKIQQPRTRQACMGELIQIDVCEHHWFEDRAPMCTALVLVDDATSRAVNSSLPLFGASVGFAGARAFQQGATDCDDAEPDCNKQYTGTERSCGNCKVPERHGSATTYHRADDHDILTDPLHFVCRQSMVDSPIMQLSCSRGVERV
jgi:hypothetical protein